MKERKEGRKVGWLLWRNRWKRLKQTLSGDKNPLIDLVFFIDKMCFILSQELR